MRTPAPSAVLELLEPVTWFAPIWPFGCGAVAAPQIVVVALFVHWSRPVHALVITALLVGQFGLMRRLLEDPREYAPFYNATGTTLYALGILVGAFALHSSVLEAP